MKRFFLGLLVFAFVFNAVSLSAYASYCPLETGMAKAKAESVMPCHQSAEQEPKSPEKPAKPGHCKGICFCQHASFGQNIMPVRFAEPLAGLILDKSLIVPSGEQAFTSVSSFPLERPPKQLS